MYNNILTKKLHFAANYFEFFRQAEFNWWLGEDIRPILVQMH